MGQVVALNRCRDGGDGDAGALQRFGIEREVVAQDVNRRPAPGAGQLDPADPLHVQRLGGSLGFELAFEGVVVGQRKHPHAVFVGASDQRRGRQGAIGSGAVAVQINIHRWRIRSH